MTIEFDAEPSPEQLPDPAAQTLPRQACDPAPGHGRDNPTPAPTQPAAEE